MTYFWIFLIFTLKILKIFLKDVLKRFQKDYKNKIVSMGAHVAPNRVVGPN